MEKVASAAVPRRNFRVQKKSTLKSYPGNLSVRYQKQESGLNYGCFI